MSEVVNIYSHEGTDQDVYIGRGSKWGNPFYIGRDGTRREVIQKYREYLKTRPDLISEIGELDGKVLTCYCRPRACHGDVLLEYLNLWRLGILEEPSGSSECMPMEGTGVTFQSR